ncbi:MAG: DUF1064 domain-containing protein [Lachnospiraceae bacterium]|jgi:hypothetical protein|nr:DUF1064 domain-containing protein [Lachnospiraceae bacterium]
MHMELKDLPPQMRKQALKKIAQEDARRAEALKAVERAVEKSKQRAAVSGFDSRGEFEFFVGTVRPKLKSGELLSCERQPAFLLFPPGEFNGEKLSSIRYTADFRLNYSDGSVEIVEVKSKFVKRMQRDYHIRRRIFIEQYARPNGWKFTEIITGDSREDIKAWKGREKT